MKLLFDENLSFRLISFLSDVFPDSVHVHEIGLGNSSDEDIWEHARQRGYTIVSKDSDFHERSLVKGFPPKIVWITRGNCSTEQIAGLLRANAVRITELHADHEAGYLMLR
jgi:predicted nuclease of predicted toxin-antitoxin system